VYTGLWWGNLRERDHLEDPSVSGRLILRWIFRKWYGGTWTGLIRLKIGSCAGTCEGVDERSGCIKCGEFLD